jgi:hypothetical protein
LAASALQVEVDKPTDVFSRDMTATNTIGFVEESYSIFAYFPEWWGLGFGAGSTTNILCWRELVGGVAPFFVRKTDASAYRIYDTAWPPTHTEVGADINGAAAAVSNWVTSLGYTSAADVTNSLNLAISPSLTDTVAKAASALQVESQTLASLGGITNTAAGIAGAGGVTNGGATVNGVVISNGAAILTYSVAPTVLTATYPTQWISVAHGGWQYLAPTGATTLAFSNDWPTPNSSLINLALFSAAAVAVDSATVSTSMWALCTLSTTATNELTFKRGFGWPRWVPVASSNWLNP